MLLGDCKHIAEPGSCSRDQVQLGWNGAQASFSFRCHQRREPRTLPDTHCPLSHPLMAAARQASLPTWCRHCVLSSPLPALGCCCGNAVTDRLRLPIQPHLPAHGAAPGPVFHLFLCSLLTPGLMLSSLSPTARKKNCVPPHSFL